MDSNWKRAVFLFDKFSHHHIYNFNKVSSQVETISWKNWETTVLGPVSQKSPKLFGPISGATIAFIPLQRQGSKPSNFSILLVFLTLKTCKKISFSEQADCSLTTSFSGPKSSRDFREASPWCVKCSLPISVCG